MAKLDAIPQHYDPAAAAARYYESWEARGFFRGDPHKAGPSFSVVIPPPNVTGSLHMGHAFNHTLQDVLVRYKRMDGHNAVWIPGTDHASIAVHWVLERQFRAEGTNRHALGREAFMERAWKFKAETEQNILQQDRRLGISPDWSRSRFTLDEGLSKAVRDVFVRLYEDGLIYRAERLVNWDPITQTTVSDLEVVYDEGVKGELWSFAYPLSDGSGEIVAATTRPETLLGDTAVAVHPDDPRYQKLVGKTVRHPLLQDRHIPIIADAVLVDPKFGTGVVKITPGHDFNDFAVGQRHKLEMINLLNKDGTLNHNAGEFAGLSTAKARVAVKAKMAELGLERGSDAHTLNIGRSERSGAVLEPMMSTQWYVRAKPLAAPALAAVENGFTHFAPPQWENTYFSWLRDIRDWCISRQLWWGHRIPAYYCQKCAHVNVAREEPTECSACGGHDLRQDDDILDTWFSSALWPFSTMGWPDKTAELAKWYPTAVLITGFDIIFFWVARMMMMGQYFMGMVPFKDVIIHPLIRDAEGEKMSKTKGNVVNPLDMIEKYGTDAFRFTLVTMGGQSRDVRWDEQRAAGYQKFANKIWQAFRFVMSNLEEPETSDRTPMPPAGTPTVYDRWILARLGHAVHSTRAALDAYKFSDASSAIYSFVWDEFCDWYLEIAKTVLYNENATQAAKDSTRHTLITVFQAVARLLHPMMPFLSEELWQHLPGAQGSIMEQAYPKDGEYADDPAATAETGFVAAAIVALRRVRAEYGIVPKEGIEALVRADAAQLKWLEAHARVVGALAKATIKPLSGTAPKQVATEVVAGAELFVPLAGLVDFAAEQVRLQKEIAKIDKDVERVNKQLGNADFVARAPEEVVVEKRALLQTHGERRSRLTEALQRLS